MWSAPCEPLIFSRHPTVIRQSIKPPKHTHTTPPLPLQSQNRTHHTIRDHCDHHLITIKVFTGLGSNPPNMWDLHKLEPPRDRPRKKWNRLKWIPWSWFGFCALRIIKPIFSSPTPAVAVDLDRKSLLASRPTNQPASAQPPASNLFTIHFGLLLFQRARQAARPSDYLTTARQVLITYVTTCVCVCSRC